MTERFTYRAPSGEEWVMIPKGKGHVEVFWRGRKLDCLILGDMLKLMTKGMGISALCPPLETMKALREIAGEGDPKELEGK